MRQLRGPRLSTPTFQEVNAGGTLNLLEARITGCTRFCSNRRKDRRSRREILAETMASESRHSRVVAKWLLKGASRSKAPAAYCGTYPVRGLSRMYNPHNIGS